MSLYPLDDRDPDGRGMLGDMRYDYERTRLRRKVEQHGRERRAQQRAVLDFLVWGWGGLVPVASSSAATTRTPVDT